VISSYAALLTACAPAAQTEDQQTGDDESSTGSPGEFEPLIDHTMWAAVDADDDPLVEHRPADIQCTIAGWFLENDALEVDTNYCKYLAIGQPSLVAVTEGRRVQVNFYHFNLVAPEPALAHIAITIDGALLWEQEIEIPGAAMVYQLEFEAPFSAPAGSPVVFHLHNHGQNTWALQSINAEQ